MRRFDWGELIVPAAMAIFAVAYWRQAITLSFPARLFPGILTAALVLFVVAGLWPLWRQATPDTSPADTVAQSGIRLAARRVAVVAIPVAVIWFLWRPLGGALSAALATALLAATLGERRAVALFGLALASGAVVELLFVRVLYARIPEGLLDMIY